MKTIKDNQKITLTVKQLKKLVKESYNAYQDHDVKQLRVDFAKWLDEEDYNEDDQAALLVLFDYYKSGVIDLNEAHRKFFDIYGTAKVAYNKFNELDQRFDREYNEMIGEGHYDDMIDEGAEFEDDEDEELPLPALDEYAANYIRGAYDSDAADGILMNVLSGMGLDRREARSICNQLIDGLEPARQVFSKMRFKNR